MQLGPIKFCLLFILAINACRCSSTRRAWISALFLSFGSLRVLFVDFFINWSLAFLVSSSKVRRFLVGIVWRENNSTKVFQWEECNSFECNQLNGTPLNDKNWKISLCISRRIITVIRYLYKMGYIPEHSCVFLLLLFVMCFKFYVTVF